MKESNNEKTCGVQGLLAQIQSPQDLKCLSESQLPQLCAEIRSVLIEQISRSGGHLSSNLGTVELTVAMHRVFSSPQDQFVWDVGHQSYTHKLLTGRKERFCTLRQEGGLSGFCKTTESEHDAFISGHSGVSISAAYGIAEAKRLKGEPGRVVAVIGDGSFTNGEVFEGINNAGRSGSGRLIVILNDNEMSISKNVGSFARYLSKIRTRPGYYRFKDHIKEYLRHIPVVGSGMESLLIRYKKAAKASLYHCNFFEEFGFTYLGPVDGHDVTKLENVLKRANELQEPVLVHVETCKGKGYCYAEGNPGEFHGVSGFDVTTGERPGGGLSYSEIFGRTLTELAKEDERICAITAAMKYATGLNYFSDAFKAQGRFFDVGIAEAHGLTFSTALAVKGLLPVFAVYSSFLQRTLDQIIHDSAIERHHLVLAIDRAGIVGEDGETHQGLFDVSFLSMVPHTTIYSPATYKELQSSLKKVLYSEKGVCAVRYPRGAQPDFGTLVWDETTDYQWFYRRSDALLITYGRICSEVFAAAEQLGCSVLKLTRIHPIPSEAVKEAANYKMILFVEEGIESGSIAQQFCARLTEIDYQGKIRIRAIQDRFIPSTSVKRSYQLAGLDCQSIVCYFKSEFGG